MFLSIIYSCYKKYLFLFSVSSPIKTNLRRQVSPTADSVLHGKVPLIIKKCAQKKRIIEVCGVYN